MRKGEVPTCSAFPDYIPREVFSDSIPHHTIMENQYGNFVFEPSEKHKKSYDEYFEKLKELISKREQLEKKANSLVKEIVEKINLKNLIRGEVRLYRGESRMSLKVDEILFFDDKENAELVSLGYNSELFRCLKDILFIESVERHKTDLEFIINIKGKCEFNFGNHTREEKRNMNKILSNIHNQKARDTLVKKGLKLITTKKLEEEIKLIFDNLGNEVNDRQIVKKLHEKGYATLWIDIYETRKKIGYKTAREIRLEKKKPR